MAEHCAANRNSRCNVGETALRETHSSGADQGTQHDQEPRMRIGQPLADLLGNRHKQDGSDRM
jgi:hypothetical protein